MTATTTLDINALQEQARQAEAFVAATTRYRECHEERIQVTQALLELGARIEAVQRDLTGYRAVHAQTQNRIATLNVDHAIQAARTNRLAQQWTGLGPHRGPASETAGTRPPINSLASTAATPAPPAPVAPVALHAKAPVAADLDQDGDLGSNTEDADLAALMASDPALAELFSNGWEEESAVAPPAMDDDGNDQSRSMVEPEAEPEHESEAPALAVATTGAATSSVVPGQPEDTAGGGRLADIMGRLNRTNGNGSGAGNSGWRMFRTGSEP